MILGVITARGGSERIPLKNIKPLIGKPLIAYMIEAATNCNSIDRLIVSTDHIDIIKIAKEYEVEVPFVRPESISGDCPSVLVMQHAVDFVEKEWDEDVEIAVTLQPTTPLVLAEDIDSCINLLLSSPQWNTVFTARFVRERPEFMFVLNEDNSVEILLGEPLRGERVNSKNLPKTVIPNGAVYATRRDELMYNDIIISSKSGAYLMPQERSVDIDVPVDFEFAEFLLSRSINSGQKT